MAATGTARNNSAAATIWGAGASYGVKDEANTSIQIRSTAEIIQMRSGAPKKVLRAGLLLFPAIILAAAPAVASAPRCEDPPVPACERVQTAEVAEMVYLRIKDAQALIAERELARIELPAVELPPAAWAAMRTPEAAWAEAELQQARWAELARIDVEAQLARLSEASAQQRVLEIEDVRKAGERFAWKIKERFTDIESDSAHPLSPTIHALVSIAKVPARSIGPLRQALTGVAKAISHVLQALLV